MQIQHLQTKTQTNIDYDQTMNVLDCNHDDYWWYENILLAHFCFIQCKHSQYNYWCMVFANRMRNKEEECNWRYHPKKQACFLAQKLIFDSVKMIVSPQLVFVWLYTLYKWSQNHCNTITCQHSYHIRVLFENLIRNDKFCYLNA